MTVKGFPYEFPVVFDVDGNNPQLPFTFPIVFGLVKARLDVTATPTATMGEAPTISCSFTFEASAFASASVGSSSGSETLAVSAEVTADALKSSFAESSTTVVAATDAEALEMGRGDGDLTVTATTTAGASAQYPSVTEFSAEATASAEVQRDATASSMFGAYLVPSVFGVNSTSSTADLEVSAGSDGDSLRDALASAALTVTAEFSCEALETGRGEGSLSVSVTVGADSSADYPASADLSVEASPSAEAHRTANADSALDAHIYSSETFPLNLPFILGKQLTEAIRDAGAEAVLDVQIIITQNISQNIVGALQILAQATGSGYLYAPVDGIDTVIEAGVSAVGYNLSRAQAETQIDVDVSSSAFKDARVEADLAIQMSTTADIRNDAVSEAALEAEASSTAIGVENDYAASESAFTATPSSDADRNAAASSSLQAEASASSDSWRETYAAGISTSAVASSRAVAAVPVLISTLTDYFNSKDESKWVFGAGAQVSGGSLTLDCASLDARVESLYSAASGSPWWKFTTGCVVSAQLPQTPDGSATTSLTISEVGCGSGNISVAWHDGYWKFSQNGGSETSVPFSTAGSWFRVRREADTIIWDTSLDGITWVERKTESISGSYVGCSVSIVGEGGTGVAYWDNFNILPIAAEVSLSLNHSTSSDVVADKFAAAYLVIDADTAQDASNNANATGSLSAYLYTDQSLMKTLNASVSLDVWTLSEGRGIEYNPVDSDFAATIESSAELSRGQDVAADFGIIHDIDFYLQRGQSIGTPILPIEFSFDGSGRNNASAHCDLSSYVSTDSDSVRVQYLAAALAAEFESSVSSVETVYGTGSLTVAAELTAAMSLGQSIEADLAAAASAFSTAVLVFYAESELDVIAFSTGQVEEPREVVRVEADDRAAFAPADDRSVSVKSDLRSCFVPRDTSRIAPVKSEVRVAMVGADSARITEVGPEDRFVPVPAVELQATI